MNLRNLAATIVIFLSLILEVGAQAPALAQEPTPWTLRNSVSFASDAAVLEYAEQSGAWRVLSKGGETVAESVGFMARLADGRSVGSAGLPPAELHREHFEGPLGKGTYYMARFAVQDGLAFEHRVASFDGRPFVVMSLSLNNRADKAVTVERLDVAVLSTQDAVSLGPRGHYESLQLAIRGGQALLDAGGSTLMGRFEDIDARVCLTIGVAGERHGYSGVRFDGVKAMPGSVDSEGTSKAQHWRGTVYTRFTPPLNIAPGETVRSADVVVVYGLSDAQQSEENYFWAAGTLWSDAATMAPPLTWLTSEEDGDFDTLFKDAERWRGTRSVMHALIPAGWERIPGSLQGATPRYPKNIGDAADALRKSGFSPGITIDPLAAHAATKPWVYASEGEGVWLNPSHPEAQAFAQERIRGLARLGFRFFAIEESPITDDALRHFGLTRSTASALAFKAARAAVPTLPVYAATVGHLPSSDQHLSNVRRALERLAEYGVPAAPIRVDISMLSDAGPSSIGALLNWPGPIEIIGLPTGKARREFGEILRQRASGRNGENAP